MLKVNAGTICGFLGRLLLIALCHALGWGVKGSGLRRDSQAGDTVALQAAIDECADAGGGTVYIASGDYYCGRLELRGNVTLQVEPGVTLRVSPDEKSGAKTTEIEPATSGGAKPQELTDSTPKASTTRPMAR